MDKDKVINSWLRVSVIASLTLGLAPFLPEPHIIGKVRWVWGGAVGMQPMDWFDFFLHGTPWFLLIIFTVAKSTRMVTGKK